MDLVVETGAAAPDSNGYMTPLTLTAYLRTRNLALPDDLTDAQIEGAIVRGSEGIDRLFAGRWPGVKVSPTQGMSWPRRNVMMAGQVLPTSPLPSAVVRAACEAAWREASSPGSLLPDSDMSQRVVSESVGPISVTYAQPSAAENAGRGQIFAGIEALLRDLLSESGTAEYGSFFLQRG